MIRNVDNERSLPTFRERPAFRGTHSFSTLLHDSRALRHGVPP
jgi:hypothetical protein